VVKGDKVYQTDQYGNRQQQAYVVKEPKTPPAATNGNTQQHTPAMQDGKIYQTDKYGNRQQQAYVLKGDKVYQTTRTATASSRRM
jgi:hypothetical protein